MHLQLSLCYFSTLCVFLISRKKVCNVSYSTYADVQYLLLRTQKLGINAYGIHHELSLDVFHTLVWEHLFCYPLSDGATC